MKTLFYSSKAFEIPYLEKSATKNIDTTFLQHSLKPTTTDFAKGFQAVSIFAGDDASTPVIHQLHQNGIKYIAIRAAGYDNVAIETCNELGIKVANVPEYSPYAIAEHTIALILCINRQLISAHQQVLNHNFKVDKLIGFDLHNKTVGIIGTGKIGCIVAKIMHGFGCNILAYDKVHNQAIVNRYNVKYTNLNELCTQSNIISIHVPLTSSTHYLINSETISTMKKDVMIINTSRGGIVNTKDILKSLDENNIGFYGTDVYEKERGVFFYDYSDKELNDTLLATLINHPKTIVTPHQAFATHEALTNIADTTFENLTNWSLGNSALHEISTVHL